MDRICQQTRIMCLMRTRPWHFFVTRQISAHLERDEHSLYCSTFHQTNDIPVSTFSPVLVLCHLGVSNYAQATSFTSILQFYCSPYTIAPRFHAKKKPNRWFLNSQIVKMVRMSKKLKTSSSTAPWCWNWYSSFSDMNLSFSPHSSVFSGFLR